MAWGKVRVAHASPMYGCAMYVVSVLQGYEYVQETCSQEHYCSAYRVLVVRCLRSKPPRSSAAVIKCIASHAFALSFDTRSACVPSPSRMPSHACYCNAVLAQLPVDISSSSCRYHCDLISVRGPVGISTNACRYHIRNPANETTLWNCR